MSTRADAIARLVAAGWTYEVHEPTAATPHPERFPTVPEPFWSWADGFTSLSSADETVWFLSARDLLSAHDLTSEGGPGFAWDELERLSLDAAAGDEEAAEVSSFWDRHLPVLQTVADGYGYIALVLSGPGAGEVVWGEEPEFEVTEAVAESFPSFVEMLAGDIEQLSPRLRRLVDPG